MKQLLRVYKVFFQNGLSYEIQYRANAWSGLLFTLGWISLSIMLTSVLFAHTSNIGGWSQADVLILAVGWNMLEDAMDIFFNNISELSDLVVEGNFDTIITKPVSSLFFVSCKTISISAIYRFLINLFSLILILHYFHIPATLGATFVAFFAFICGMSILAAISLLLNILCFYFERVENINNAWYTALAIGKYPLSVFPRWLKLIFLTLVPIAFSGYLPIGIFLNKIEPISLLYIFGFTCCILAITHITWHRAIRHYTSASS